MDLEVVRKGGNAEGREFLKLVTEFIESEARQNFPYLQKTTGNFFIKHASGFLGVFGGGE